MALQDSVNIREVTSEDLNFILSSSVSCLSQYTESIFKGWDRKDIYEFLNKFIISSLHQLDFSIFIASHKDDSNQIIGYIVANPETNYVYLQYTKFVFRNLGVQKQLLMPLVIDTSKPITVAWPTKEMLKLKKDDKVKIYNQTILDLITKE
ncbi:MAG: hypothetical protein ACK40T_02790 [Akkermansiaceae bacterium]|jgi:hypothetical protein